MTYERLGIQEYHKVRNRDVAARRLDGGIELPRLGALMDASSHLHFAELECFQIPVRASLPL